MKVCDQERRLTSFLLGDLSVPEADDMRRHLEQCAACREAVQQIEPALVSLRAALARDAGTQPRFSSARRAGLMAIRPRSRHRVIRWIARPLPGLAVAAGVLFFLGVVAVSVRFADRQMAKSERLMARTIDGDATGVAAPQGVEVAADTSDLDILTQKERQAQRPDDAPLSLFPEDQATGEVGGDGRRVWREGEKPVFKSVPPEDSRLDAPFTSAALEDPPLTAAPPSPPEAWRRQEIREARMPEDRLNVVKSPVVLRGIFAGSRRGEGETVGLGLGRGEDVLQEGTPDKATLERSASGIADRGDRLKGEKPGRDAEKPAEKMRAPVIFNPFVETTSERFSTFSIDVDTASYTLTRQAIRAGRLPEPEIVRTEEIVNAFDYGDTASDHATFRVHVEGAPSPFGPDLKLLRIGVKGRRLGREERRPAMLTLLIDTSGSMGQPDRIGLARIALKRLIENLAPSDHVQIVAYDDRARVVLDPTPPDRAADTMAAFDALQCAGSTNLEAGMRLAYERAARAFVPGAENRVILISDGVANLGATDAADILARVDAYRRQGLTFSVFGVGQGPYNDRLLEQLANKGDGVYRFLDSEEEVQRAFVDDLAATLNMIAADVKIQVEWNAAAVRRYRQLGYENRALTREQFRDDTVDAGEIGSGQSVTALYEIEVAPEGLAPRTLLGTVRVRYRRIDTRAVEEIATPIPAAALARNLDATRPQFRLAAAAAEFAEILRGSPHAAGGRFEDVARLLRPVALDLPLDTRVKELLNLAEQAATMTR